MTIDTLRINKLEDAAIGRAISALSAFDSTQKSFVDFTTHLLHDVFKILLDATIEQLEAYADLVANVSGSLQRFEERMVGDQPAFEARAVTYINDVILPSFADPGFAGPVVAPSTPTSFKFDTTKLDSAKAAYAGVVVVTGTAPNTAEKDFTAYLTSVNEMPTGDLITLSVAKLKQDVKGSYDKLVTILKIGMQKLVVTDGEVKTSLTWHLDATDTDELTSSDTSQTFDQRAVNWGVSRTSARSSGISGKLFGMTLGRARGVVTTAGANGSRTRTELKVQVVNEKKTAVTNLNIDITGSVMVHFKSETFPPFDPATVPA
ncbi:MAG: hypothetical protein QOJ84_5275 [Bradyrhizobium sp.]|jgi:hypothetical protein|nr:hypothetical protein [Bradyrhizobium sp.]